MFRRDGVPPLMVGCRSSAGLARFRRVGPKLAAIQQTFIQSRTKSVRSKVGGVVRSNFVPVARGRRGGSQETCGWDRGRIGALAAVGTIDGPEVQVLKDCFSRAKRSAQERPLAADQPDGVVPREGKEEADSKRQTLVTDMEQSEGRLKRLRAVAAAADAIPRPRPPGRPGCKDSSRW